MRLLKRLSIILLSLILIAGGCTLYAFKIEPFRIQINGYTFSQNQDDTPALKIAQISDLHIKEDFPPKSLDKLVEKINAQDPDIVLFTGDLYDNYAMFRDDEQVIARLQKIEAAYGKIAIWGNRDYGGGASRQYESIMDRSGFTLLKNSSFRITAANGKNILLTGLDDSLLGQPMMPEEGKSSPADYRILLTHEPDAIDAYLSFGYDLALSGHSHGGQINIPFLPFINEAAAATSSLSSKYIGGMYTFGAEQQQKLYVNTGIGTTHISARFGVVPEIAVFNICL